MNLGHQLRKIRKQKGYSIRQVVMRSGGLLDKTTVSRIERGERNMSVRALYAFSRIYEMSADDILEVIVKNRVKSGNPPFDVNEEERRIIELYRVLPRQCQNTARDLMAHLVRSALQGPASGAGKAKTQYPSGKRLMHQPAISEPPPEEWKGA